MHLANGARPGFGARLIDLLACPLDGGFPLVLEEARERAWIAPGDPPRAPLCHEHCGRLDSPISALDSPPPCATCLATEVELGALRCPRCARRYPIRDAIASFVDDAEPDAERATRDAEAAIYDELYPDAEYVHELRTYARLLAPADSDLVLDVGCGTGRALRPWVGSVRECVAVDFSRASLLRLRERGDLPAGARVWPLQADATALPLRAGRFDKAVCLSLICFLPDALQPQFLDRLRGALKPAAALVISSYNYAAVKRLWALAGRTDGALKRGMHSNGTISYVNHTPHEFRQLLAAAGFRCGVILGICHRLPFLSKLGARLSAALDGLMARLPFGRALFATEMVTRAEARATEDGRETRGASPD